VRSLLRLLHPGKRRDRGIADILVRIRQSTWKFREVIISPFRAERRMARELVAAGEFYEVFVDTPLSLAEQRDPKGLYKKARRGDLKNFTGIDSPYERPENPEIRIDTAAMSPEDAAEHIVAHLRTMSILDPL
jgi:bifunctional enzyme CysN/CysC